MFKNLCIWYLRKKRVAVFLNFELMGTDVNIKTSTMLNEPFTENEVIRIMPDVHAGKGSTIGTTMTINNGKVVPNLVGVDIGCGILVSKVSDVKEDTFTKLDEIIRENVPSGYNVRNKMITDRFNFRDLSFGLKNHKRVQLSKGTLGGGNHFIELGIMDGEYYLLIHSGSRNLGVQVARHHQDKAIAYHSNNSVDVNELILKMHAEGRQKEIQSELEKIKPKEFNKELAYLERGHLRDYLNDMEICQRFAKENRELMADVIIAEMGWKLEDRFDSVHNYIDIKNKILRKGATDASLGKRLVIPLNMRDGSIIANGLGNWDWNYSAPHGAGRTMSRKKARENISMNDFSESMKDVFSTSVTENTIDESPFAYKDKEDIISNIADTVNILGICKPVYNFKAQ